MTKTRKYTIFGLIGAVLLLAIVGAAFYFGGQVNQYYAGRNVFKNHLEPALEDHLGGEPSSASVLVMEGDDSIVVISQNLIEGGQPALLYDKETEKKTRYVMDRW